MLTGNVVQVMTLNESLISRFDFDPPTAQNAKLVKIVEGSTNCSFHFDLKQHSLPKS
jgi:hypothetical protein